MTGNDPLDGERSGPFRSVVKLSVVVTILILALVWSANEWRGEMDGRRALLAVCATFPAMLASIGFTGWRLAALTGERASIRQGLAVNSVGQLIALILPSRLSEVAKPAGLNLLCGVPLGEALTILAIERVLDALFLAALVFLAVAGIAGPDARALSFGGAVLGGVALAGAATIAVVLLKPGLPRRFAGLIPWAWLASQMVHAEKAIARMGNGRVALSSLALSGLAWLAAYGVFLAFFGVLDLKGLGADRVLVVFVASTVGLIVSVAPGGLGTFEGAVALTLMSYGYSGELSVSTAVLLRICLVLPTLAAAGWFLVAGDLNVSRILRRVRQLHKADHP